MTAALDEAELRSVDHLGRDIGYSPTDIEVDASGIDVGTGWGDARDAYLTDDELLQQLSERLG